MADKLRWEIIDNTGAQAPKWYYSNAQGVTMSNAPGGQGLSAEAIYKGLFAQNNHFGKRKVKLTIDIPELAGESDETEVEIFFDRSATNHPGNRIGAANPTPNWFYYWLQTIAQSMTSPYTFQYSRSIGSQTTMGTSTIIINDNDIMQPYNAPYGQNNPLQGIDNFTWTVIHEVQHQRDFTAFWKNNFQTWNNSIGKNDRDDDKDGDKLPNYIEDINLNGIKDQNELYDWNNKNTPTPNRPNSIVDDLEDRTCQMHRSITGNKRLDWGYPGMNHREIDNPNN